MLTFLFLAVSPLLSHAQQRQQTALKEDLHNLVVPLTLGDDRIHTFELALGGPRQLSSKAIAELGGYRDINSRLQSVLINIPIDATQSGTLVLDTTTTNGASIHQDIEWIDTLEPGEDIPIAYVGIRKGAMVSMDAYATRLALGTPYISLPNEIFDILVQATKPTLHQHNTGYDDVVDCNNLERYPDLVLGLQPDMEDAQDDEGIEIEQMVITPQQYILQTKEGQCVLLVQRNRAEVVLGWAALRGRAVVLDWVNERTGFGW